jgi:hypothetical protein
MNVAIRLVESFFQSYSAETPQDRKGFLRVLCVLSEAGG